MPLEASMTIASPAPRRSPSESRSFGLTMPVHDAARSIRPGSTMPASAGVSPPPQAMPQWSQARFQPATSSAERSPSANQSEPPAAQYAWTTSGVAPTVIRSLTAIAIVSWAMLA